MSFPDRVQDRHRFRGFLEKPAAGSRVWRLVPVRKRRFWAVISSLSVCWGSRLRAGV